MGLAYCLCSSSPSCHGFPLTFPLPAAPRRREHGLRRPGGREDEGNSTCTISVILDVEEMGAQRCSCLLLMSASALEIRFFFLDTCNYHCYVCRIKNVWYNDFFNILAIINSLDWKVVERRITLRWTTISGGNNVVSNLSEYKFILRMK